MNNPLISIAMATYNGEKYLKEQLDSIYNQTYKNIEVIVCDDCSNDNTVKILEEYKNKYGLKYFINKVNLGYVKNFEKAISLCNGDYIALSDQDDIWLPEKLEILLANIGDNFVIHSDAYLIDEKNELISESYTRFSKKMVNPINEIDMILNGCVTGCTTLIKKDFLLTILPFPEYLYVHDKYIGFASFLEGKLIYIDKPLIKYRQHNENNIGASDANINLLNKINKLLMKNNNIFDFFIFQKSYNNQKLFCKIIKDNFGSKLKKIDEIKIVCRLYTNIVNIKNINLIIKDYIYLFKYIEKNKPLKYKLYIMTHLISKILYFRIIDRNKNRSDKCN